MPGFQERGIVGKTIKELKARKRHDTSRPELVYHESCVIYFTDGSLLVLLASDDEDGPTISTQYTPAKRRK